MRTSLITDPADRRLSGFADLVNPAARDRIERRRGVFVVEGALALEQLLASPYRLHSTLVAANRLDRVAGLVGDLDAPLYVASPEVLAGVVGFDVHRGILALGERLALPEPRPVLDDVAAAGGRLVVVAEGINDHENLGAIFRNAAAFGAGAVLADPSTCDPLYRRSIRVSLGHVLRIPFARLEPWPAGLAELRRGGWTTLALTPAGDAERLDTVAADPPPRMAVLVGSEGAGLRPATVAAADRRVGITMAAGVDSLNVATATAIALHRLADLPQGAG